MKKVLLIAVAIVILIQLVPVDRENPPVTAPLDGPAEIVTVLKESCYDCHSNETTWPWYAYVAPVSWLVASDVSEGREHLNFSEWAGLDRNRQLKLADEVLEEVNEGEMPLEIYLVNHDEAKLTESDLATIRAWADSVKVGMPMFDVPDDEEEE